VNIIYSLTCTNISMEPKMTDFCEIYMVFVFYWSVIEQGRMSQGANRGNWNFRTKELSYPGTKVP